MSLISMITQLLYGRFIFINLNVSSELNKKEGYPPPYILLNVLLAFNMLQIL
nr:MAG TPA: hypothetical protein [Caudoviricetes sp.]